MRDRDESLHVLQHVTTAVTKYDYTDPGFYTLERARKQWGDRMVPHTLDRAKRAKAKAARVARRKGRKARKGRK